MAYPHFTVAATKTTVNAGAYLLTGRRSLLLEGRLRRGVYRNWSGDRRHRANWSQPQTEEEVNDRRTEIEVKLSGRNWTGVEIVGHSFSVPVPATGPDEPAAATSTQTSETGLDRR